MQIVPEDRNLISNGAWDGDVVKLFEFDKQVLNKEIALYKSILTLPVKCNAFGMMEEIVVVNQETETVSVFDLRGNLLRAFQTNFFENNYFNFVHDFFLDKLYFLIEEGATTGVYHCDYLNGETIKVIVLPWLARNASNGIISDYKILGNRIYFKMKNSNIQTSFSLYSYAIR